MGSLLGTVKHQYSPRLSFEVSISNDGRWVPLIPDLGYGKSTSSTFRDDEGPISQ